MQKFTCSKKSQNKKYQIQKYSSFTPNLTSNGSFKTGAQPAQVANIRQPTRTNFIFRPEFSRFKEAISKKCIRRITNRNRRQRLMKEYPFLFALSKCNSKVQMKTLFKQLSPKWKSFLQFYLSRCFIFHLFIRQIKNLKLLMRCREELFQALDQPEIVSTSLPFTSNLVKNFCKGVSNFVVMFYDELLEQRLIPKPIN